RDFDVGIERPIFGNCIERCRHRCSAHQRWCAAAEEDRFDIGPPAALQRREMAKLARDCVDPSRLVDFRTNMAVEIAIRALGRAERPMHIDSETAHFSAATSLAKARARWLIACLRAGSISPKVSLMPSATKIGS